MQSTGQGLAGYAADLQNVNPAIDRVAGTASANSKMGRVPAKGGFWDDGVADRRTYPNDASVIRQGSSGELDSVPCRKVSHM